MFRQCHRDRILAELIEEQEFAREVMAEAKKYERTANLRPCPCTPPDRRRPSVAGDVLDFEADAKVDRDVTAQFG
jgi:hypothetical protein